jgi:hypothetical protein
MKTGWLHSTFRALKHCAFALCIACAWFSPSRANAEDVDLELVLAMDTSGSISVADYLLQLKGTAEAFRDPAVQNAITSGPHGKIAVNVLLWSDASLPKINSGWFVLDGPDKAIAFAKLVSTFRVNEDNTIDVGGRGTGIGAGIEEAVRLLNSNLQRGQRRVIDVSGDGIETKFWFPTSFTPLSEARDLADAQGITINGLPILSQRFPDLDDYYRKQVITGPGSFVVVAENFQSFGTAIRQKLLREISRHFAAAPVRQVTKFTSRSRNLVQFDDNKSTQLLLPRTPVQ